MTFILTICQKHRNLDNQKMHTTKLAFALLSVFFLSVCLFLQQKYSAAESLNSPAALEMHLQKIEKADPEVSAVKLYGLDESITGWASLIQTWFIRSPPISKENLADELVRINWARPATCFAFRCMT